MILKILLILIVVGVIYFMFIKKKPLNSFTDTKSDNDEKPKTNEMIECFACGTYVEIGEMIISRNHYYCCQECMDKA